MLSIICPIYNEERYIEQCIDSILKQDYPLDDIELLLVDGMSTDNTLLKIKPYTEQYSWIKVLKNPKRTAPCAMNVGIRAAKGDIIIRIDAHARYANNYVSTLVHYLTTTNADNVGAVWHTDVKDKTPKTLAIREVLCSKIGVGNATFRIGTDSVREVDTVPFGCWRREVFDKYGMFDEQLTRNQDFELNRRILGGGGKILLVPGTYCVYYARDSFTSLWKQNYKNGLWGIRTVLITGNASSLALRHYVPMIFLLSLIIPLVASIVWLPIIWIAIASIVAYLLLISSVSIRLGIKNHLNPLYLIMAFMVLHISNGCGMLVSAFTARSYVKQHSKR